MDSSVHRGKPGHEGYLNEHVSALPENLREKAGYYTCMAGKWNLGIDLEHCPHQRGFDRSFALLAPTANHFAWDHGFSKQEDESRLPKLARMNVSALHVEDGRYVDNEELPTGFYSSDHYVDKLMEQLDARPKDKNFFAYLHFSASSPPLQAPQEDIEQYRGLYDDGPKALRERRLQALKKRGLIPPDTVPHGMDAPEIGRWGSLSVEQRAKSAREMETYAAMVSRVDYNVGRLLSWLKFRGLFDNTQIIFTSSSGPCGASPDKETQSGLQVQRYIARHYNNTFLNIGSKTSYTWYGARWAHSGSPFRLYQGFPTEGGTRVPMIYKPPASLKFKKQICHSFCTVQDIAPTLLHQAGIPVYGNDTDYIPEVGRSWLPFFQGMTPFPHPVDYAHGWELDGQGALRKGSWKIVCLNRPLGNEEWELFNLSEDPGEITDLSRRRPDKLEELVKEWIKYKDAVSVVGLTPQLRRTKGEMTDPSTWVKFETSRSVALREKQRRERPKSTTRGSHDSDDDDDFQDLDDDAVEMV